jgi:hypothetical protein
MSRTQDEKEFVLNSSWVSGRTNSYRVKASLDRFDSIRLIFSHSSELWYLNWFLCSQAVHPDYDLGWSLQWSHITLFYNLVSDLHASLPSCACDGCCLLRLSRDSFTGVALNILLCMNYWASFFRHHCVCISLAFCNLFSFCFFFKKKGNSI